MGGKLDQREDGLRIVWMWICRIFVVICILAELVVFIAEIIIVGTHRYDKGFMEATGTEDALLQQMVNSVQRHANLFGYGNARKSCFPSIWLRKLCQLERLHLMHLIFTATHGYEKDGSSKSCGYMYVPLPLGRALCLTSRGRARTNTTVPKVCSVSQAHPTASR